MPLTDRLKAAIAAQGIDVRDAAESTGVCEAAYVVVRDGGVTPRGRSNAVRVTIATIYVPYKKPEQLANLRERVKTALLAAGQKLGAVSSHEIDDTYKAAECEIQVYTPCAI